jgi:hypothetical protein
LQPSGNRLQTAGGKMKMPDDKKMVLDTATGRWKFVDRINPKLDTSKQIAMRKSKRQKVVRRSV